MSKQKQILALAVVAIFLVATLVGGVIVRNGGFSSSGVTGVVAAGLDAKHISSITIAHGATAIDLKKENGNWYSATDAGDALPVRESRIDDFITALKSLNLGRIVSRGTEAYSQLKIDDASAWKLTLNRDDGVVQPPLYFGDINGQLQYLRTEGKPDVSTVASAAAFYLQQEPKYWFERRVWPDVDLRTVKSFTFQAKGKSPVVIAKNENAGGWNVQQGDRPWIKKDQIPSWVQAMAVLEADDIQAVPEKSALAWYSESARLSVTNQDGAERTLVFYTDGKKEDPLLAIPDFPQAPTSQKGVKLCFLVPEWKLQRGVVE